MPIYKVNYKDFKSENIVFGKTEECNTSDASGKKIVYYRIPIMYKYEVKRNDGTTTYPTSNLYIEGPKEKSRGPTKKEFEKNGSMKEQYSILTKYDLGNEDHLAFVNRDPRNGKPFGTIHKLVMACAQLVYDRGKEVNINDCMDENEMLRNKFYYPMKWTLERGLPTGENPAGIWKLFRYGKEGHVNETSFYLPIDGGKKVDWSMIEGTQIDHQPVFRVDNITIAGGKPTIKIELASSVIYDIASGGPQKIQEDTIKQATSADPLLEARLREQIRQLEEALASTKVSKSPTAVSGSIALQQVVGSEEVRMLPPTRVEPAQSQAKPEPEVLPLPLPAPVNDLKSMLNSAPVINIPGLPSINLPAL